MGKFRGSSYIPSGFVDQALLGDAAQANQMMSLGAPAFGTQMAKKIAVTPSLEHAMQGTDGRSVTPSGEGGVSKPSNKLPKLAGGAIAKAVQGTDGRSPANAQAGGVSKDSRRTGMVKGTKQQKSSNNTRNNKGTVIPPGASNKKGKSLTPRVAR